MNETRYKVVYFVDLTQLVEFVNKDLEWDLVQVVKEPGYPKPWSAILHRNDSHITVPQ